MVRQSFVELPGFAAVRAHPETCRIDAGVDCLWLVLTAGLNDPDVLELLAAVLGKLDALLRLLPRLSQVVAVAHEGAKEGAVVGGEHAPSVSAVQRRVVHARVLQ